MPLINWTDNLSVKVKEIDQQHKKLFDLINNLHDAMKSGKGKDAVASTLEELIKYTEYHFSFEEGLLKKSAYPDLPGHKTKHQKLTDQVKALRAKAAEGSLSVTVELMSFLKSWLNDHILETDKLYSAHLNAKGVN